MSVAVSSFYDSLTAATDSGVTYTDAGSNTTITSDDFLTLLVTELEYQDPTDPMDNTEMVNQLTQYSQLDELTAIGEQLESISSALSASAALSSIDYIGKEVEAEGAAITKSGDGITPMEYELGDAAASLTMNIYDSTGSIVESEVVSNTPAGNYTLQWDGKDFNGDTLDDGTYYVLMSAEDIDGAPVSVSTTTSGTVTGVATTNDGVILTLDDGREVNLADVTYTS